MESLLTPHAINRRLNAALGALLVALTIGVETVHAELRFRVVDQDGNPVPDAVLELHAPASAATGSKPSAATWPLARMDQVDKQFRPGTLVVHRGQAVEFPNSDRIRHHVYSFSPAKTFELKLYADDHGAPVVFEVPGIVVLGCNIHDNMLGYIYVADSAAVALSDEQGEGRVAPPASVDQATLWHPGLSPDGQQRLSLPWPLPGSDSNATPILLTLPMQAPEGPPSSESANTPKDRFDRFRRSSP